MIGSHVIHELGVSGQHFGHTLQIVGAVDEVLVELGIGAHHDVFKHLAGRPAFAVAQIQGIFPVGHLGGQFIAQRPELVPGDVLMIRNGHTVLFKYVDIVENHIGLMNADGHDILVAIGGGAQCFQAGKRALGQIAVFPHLVQVQQHIAVQIGLDFLAGMGLEGFGALARLLQHLYLHHHGTARTAGNGVGLGLDLAVRIAKALDHTLDGILFAARRPPVVHIHGALLLGGLQDGGNVHGIRVFLFILLGSQRGGGGQRQDARQCKRCKSFQLHSLRSFL